MSFKIPWISIRLVKQAICFSKELVVMSWFVKALCVEFVMFSSCLLASAGSFGTPQVCRVDYSIL